MTIVICDSSLLILVSKLEIIDLLVEVFGQVIIPPFVYLESVEHGKKLKKMDRIMADSSELKKFCKQIAPFRYVDDTLEILEN